MRKVRSSSWMRFVSALLVAVLGVGTVGVGAGAAQEPVISEPGNFVLYPLIIKDDPRTITLVTYIGPNFSEELGDRPNGLHYQYHSKSAIAPATPTSACSSSSIPGNTSPNDVLTFDSSGHFGTQPFFDDNTSAGVLGLNLVAPSPSLAYLLINAQTGQGPNFGEAQILDLANAGVWGYNAVAIPAGSDGTGIGGGAALLSGTRRPVHLFPPDTATTNFAVTPTGTDMQNSSVNRARLQMQVSSPPGGGTNLGGVYDRNENPIDFSIIVQTECVWIFPLVAFVGTATLDRASWRAGGGWSWLANVGGTGNNSALVFKVISAGSAGSFIIDGQPVSTGLCGFDDGVLLSGTTGGCGAGAD